MKSKPGKYYAALTKLVGVGPKGVNEASITIDELLYGENGVWRGMTLEDTFGSVIAINQPENSLSILK